MIWDLAVPELDVVEDLVDVVADVAFSPEPLDIALRCVLRPGRGFPLVAPDDLPADPLQADAEAADAGEEFDDARSVDSVG